MLRSRITSGKPSPEFKAVKAEPMKSCVSSIRSGDLGLMYRAILLVNSLKISCAYPIDIGLRLTLCVSSSKAVKSKGFPSMPRSRALLFVCGAILMPASETGEVGTPVAQTSPSQIPACGTTAPGSSMILTSATEHKFGGRYSPQGGWLAVIWSNSPGQVSFAGCVSLSTPSPCRRLSRPQSTMGESDSLKVVSHPSSGWIGLPECSAIRCLGFSIVRVRVSPYVSK